MDSVNDEKDRVQSMQRKIACVSQLWALADAQAERSSHSSQSLNNGNDPSLGQTPISAQRPILGSRHPGHDAMTAAAVSSSL